MMALLDEPCQSEMYLLGQELPDLPQQSIESYDFQIVQPALRFVLPDLSITRIPQNDHQEHEQLFQHAVDATVRYLANAMRWNIKYGILTFVFPYITPIQNPIGRLLPRYDLCNPVYFVEELNRRLARELVVYQNTYLFDLNEVYATFGKRLVQDDIFLALNHAGLFSDFDYQHDQGRLEKAKKASEIFDADIWSIFIAAWQEITSMYKTVVRIDAVKMVSIDLDDTLWRGVMADTEQYNSMKSEGWPKGFWEALLILKRRGILLTIISKNEEKFVAQIWERIFHNELRLDDFVVRRINWKPKSENMQDILQLLNLRPENVVYVDDNPVERAAMETAFPDIRVLGGTPLTWRRILLWSPETQVPFITDESVARSQMVIAQVSRDEDRKTKTSTDFLSSLCVRVKIFEIEGVTHPRFSRALELLNKTNQYNTTGKRWTLGECVAAFDAGSTFFVWEVADKFTNYGLVGVAIVSEAGILQLVMSCRVMGLETELAAIAHIVELFCLAGAETISAQLVQSEKNLPCHDVFARCGFLPFDAGWRRGVSQLLSYPQHITLPNTELPTNAQRPANANKIFCSRLFTEMSRRNGIIAPYAVTSNFQLAAGTFTAGFDKEVAPTKTIFLHANTSIEHDHGIKLLHEVIFGLKEGNETDYVRNGWASPEPNDRWAIGKSSEMEFPCPPATDVLLELEIWPFIRLPEIPSQHLSVQVNGMPIGDLLIVKNSRETLRIPAAAFLGHEAFKLQFFHPNSAIPAQFGQSNDMRCIGVCFRRLRLFSVPYVGL
jgi:FkbH-like protein